MDVFAHAYLFMCTCMYGWRECGGPKERLLKASWEDDDYGCDVTVVSTVPSKGKFVSPHDKRFCFLYVCTYYAQTHLSKYA